MPTTTHETGNADALRSKYKLYNHDLDSRSHECGCSGHKDRGITPSSLDLILKYSAGMAEARVEAIQNVYAACMLGSCVANALDPIVDVITIITCGPSIPRICTTGRIADCTSADEDAVALRDAA